MPDPSGREATGRHSTLVAFAEQVKAMVARAHSTSATDREATGECQVVEMTCGYPLPCPHHGEVGREAAPPENPCWPGATVIGGTYSPDTRAVRLHVRHPNGTEVVVVGHAESPPAREMT